MRFKSLVNEEEEDADGYRYFLGDQEMEAEDLEDVRRGVDLYVRCLSQAFGEPAYSMHSLPVRPRPSSLAPYWMKGSTRHMECNVRAAAFVFNRLARKLEAYAAGRPFATLSPMSDRARFACIRAAPDMFVPVAAGSWEMVMAKFYPEYATRVLSHLVR